MRTSLVQQFRCPVDGTELTNQTDEILVSPTGREYRWINDHTVDFRTDHTLALASETSDEQLDFYEEKFGAQLNDLKSLTSYGMLELAASVKDVQPEHWCDALPEFEPQRTSIEHLYPVDGQFMIQVGGHGQYAVAALLAGASPAALLTPVLAEAELFLALAEEFGVLDNAYAIIAGAEAIPLGNDCVDVMYSSGSLHHTDTNLSIAEFDRVLRPGGRFSAIDPWLTPVYDLGIRVFGKREDVDCRPLDSDRLIIPASLQAATSVTRHSPVIRYVLALMHLKGHSPSRRLAERALTLEAAIVPTAVQQRFGSCSLVTFEAS